MAETWKQMEQLVGNECRAIGVSNFSVKNLEILLKDAQVVPAVDQVILQEQSEANHLPSWRSCKVECHIYLPQAQLDKYCKAKGIVLTSYSPLGQPPSGQTSAILREPLVTELAKKYNTQPGTVSCWKWLHRSWPAKILISWVAQRDNWTVIPKSSNPQRLKANLEVSSTVVINLTRQIVKLDQRDHDALSNVHQEPGKLTSLVDYAEKMRNEGTVFGWTVQEMGWEQLN
jgi:glycerol 2-dehydrogenase (NADP+)